MLTDSLDETVDELVAVGGDLRRRRDDLHAPMAFVRMGESIVEVVQSDAAHPARIWGLVAIVEDLATLPPELVGEPRDAVQPGRRIVTVRPEAGLGTAVAFMTPRAITHPLGVEMTLIDPRLALAVAEQPLDPLPEDGEKQGRRP